MNFNQSLLIFLIIALILVTGCTSGSDAGIDNETSSHLSMNETMCMSVSSVINGSTLPLVYSCTGPGQVPSINWKNVPPGTQSLVLILDDPDAPNGVFTHWIVYNLTPESGSIPPNQLPILEHAGTGLQGINSMNTRGYAPPCPPGNDIHRYIFTLYALDVPISSDYPDRSHIDTDMQGHVLDQARIVTFFGQ